MPRPDKRSSLTLLTKDRLRALAEALELETKSSMRHDELVEVLASSRRASFETVLGEMKREELKAICREHGLDDSGKVKEEIVARILGRSDGPAERAEAVQTSLPMEEADGFKSSKKRGRKGKREAEGEAEVAVETSAAASEPAAGERKVKRRKSKGEAAGGGNGNGGGDLDFRDTLWKAADKLRANMDASEYKHVVLGLIFLKYVSDAFEERREKLKKELENPESDSYEEDEEVRQATLEERDEYTAENVFWVPVEARWERIKVGAKSEDNGEIIDAAMEAIEDDNPDLEGVLPKDYARPTLDKLRLGELVDLIGGITLGNAQNRSKDTLGRVYEYFLSQFASAEGKKSGQFYTPRPVVQLLVEMLAPYKGRVYDPCCGSGGMFVQSSRFVEEHAGKRADISVYGQESNPTTWRLAKMNLAIREIRGNLGEEAADSFHRDLHKDLKADYVLANPPFNDSDWRGELLAEDVRWKYGTPPKGNANFAWIQHFVHHLAPHGVAGFVMANGSMSSQQSGEGEIRKALVEADLVDCMVALPGQLFFSTQIPVCLWVLARDKKNGVGKEGRRLRDRSGEVLFIDARKLGTMISRVQRELTDVDRESITNAYHRWRGDEAGVFTSIPGFCNSVAVEEIQKNDYILTPARYVGSGEVASDEEPIGTRLPRLAADLRRLFSESHKLALQIAQSLEAMGYGDSDERA